MPHMLVKIDVAYDRVPEFVEVMAHLVPTLEQLDWKLLGAWQTQIGRLNRVYDLWEIPDSNIGTVLEQAGHDPDFQRWTKKLTGLVIEETIEVMNSVPYSPL